MRTIIQYVNNQIFRFLPETRCFGLKRVLVRLCGAKIGKNVRIGSSVMIIGAGKLEIGDNTWIGPRCLISASSYVKIGCNTDIAPNVFIGNGTHEITPEKDRIADVELAKDIEIGNGCWICANSAILAGVKIGRKCVVAAGAVVTKSCEDRVLLAGVPAVVKKNL